MSLHEGQEFENLLGAIAEIARLRDRCQHLQVERDLLAGKLDVAEDALKEIAGRCHNRLATIAEIALPYQHSSK